MVDHVIGIIIVYKRHNQIVVFMLAFCQYGVVPCCWLLLLPASFLFSRQHLILLEKSVDPIRCYPVINLHIRGEQDIGMKLSTAFPLRGSFLTDVITCLLPKKARDIAFIPFILITCNDGLQGRSQPIDL